MSVKNAVPNTVGVISDTSHHSTYNNNNDGQFKSDEHRDSCFYNLCERSSYWDGWVVCGRFKSRNNVVFCTFLTIMCFTLMLSVIGPLVLYSIADDSINSEVVIDSTSAVNYESWQSNAYGSGYDDVKVKYDLYYFDVQNAAQILQGAQPVVVEVGPYSFDEYYVKFDIEWSDGGDTVTYNTQKYYVWNQANSGPGLTIDDQITLPYATAIAFQFLLGKLPPEVSATVDYVVTSKLLDKYHTISHNLTKVYNQIPERPAIKFDPIRAELVQANNTLNMLFTRLIAFVSESNTVDLLFKTLLCGTPGGISPFFSTNPVDAWFGWLNDPLLMEVQLIIDKVNAGKPANETIAWTSAVPGPSFNWTSIEETRRRRNPDTFKTGKKNKNQVAQYVRFNGMDLDRYHVCVVPMDSQNVSDYTEGEQYPSCALFQNSWTDEEAEQYGYVRPFATDYANRLAGTDANMYGRPVRSDKIQVFVSDIYRSAFLENKGDVDWNGVTLRRFGLQEKDMLNATVNPENAQYYNFAPSGMENTTQAAGVPVFVSFPHFYQGDSRLVAAVKGIAPNDARHETYIDVEPQTGLLARAAKKLQVNYLIESKTLPQTAPDTLSIAHGICKNFTIVEQALIDNGIVNATQLPDLGDCNNILVTGLLTCLAAPSDWQIQDNAIYFPFGWANEQMNLPDSAAEDLNDSLFLVDDLAEGVRFWCLIASGICFAVLASMVLNSHYDTQERRKEQLQKGFKDGSAAYTTEPLLSSAPPGPGASFST